MTKILNVDIKSSDDIPGKWKTATPMIIESIERILNKEDTVLADDLNELVINVRFLPR